VPPEEDAVFTKRYRQDGVLKSPEAIGAFFFALENGRHAQDRGRGMNKNKIFKVIWEVHVEREDIEKYMQGEFSEKDVQDWVFLQSEQSMQSCFPHEARWVDENNEEIKLERKIIYKGWEERLDDMPAPQEGSNSDSMWDMWDEED
jgi:hypothetical protein